MLKTLTSEEIFKDLNEAQHQAVAHSEGPLLLVAGAGSGKTTVVTRRMANLILTEKAKPWEILGVTFTNKAAAEMKERVFKLTGQDVMLSTFHSFGARVLREHGTLLGLKPGFVIYDSADQKTVMKETLKTLDVSTDQFKPAAVIGKISRLKDELIDPVTYEDFANGPYEEVVSKAYHIYEATLKENNALDFSDLILSTVKLMATQPDVLHAYQDRYRYLMVDEYQDTNYGQYQLVKLLAKKYENLCVVGDPDQSIYSWRGADIRNIMNFEKDYADTEVINLEHNYRSTEVILEAANHVIEKNLNRKPKQLRATRMGGEKIKYYQAVDGRDEADYVAQVIQNSRARGVALRDMAILYRVHALSRSLEEAFMSSNIPYKILGGMKFYERKEIKDILCYLRFIANPSDRISFQRIMNVPKRGLGPSSLAKLQDYAADQQLAFAEVLNRCETVPTLTPRIVNKLKPFVSLIASLREKSQKISVGELLKELLEAIEFEDYLKLDDPATFATRQENIKELFAAIGEYEQKHPEGDLLGYLEEVSLLMDVDEKRDIDEYIVMMTVHNAKGLEYESCFLVGMEEGIFPHGGKEDDIDEMEEERRLCYVAITRAKDDLYISSSMRRMMYGRWKQCEASRFLYDIPDELLEGSTHSKGRSLGDDDDTSEGTSPWKNLPDMQDASIDSGVTLRPGEEVFHQQWGLGRVVQLTGQGEQARVKVMFGNGYGSKDLMLKYANLSKV